MDTTFSSCQATFTINEQKFNVRVLKMHKSTLIFLTNAGAEFMDEMAVAMQMISNQKTLGTTILGKEMMCESQSIAERLTKRYNRQFFVSFNVKMDRTIALQLEQQLNEYIQKNQTKIV